MRRILRTDERAVSPIIATILLVAITVVLASVLYLALSGLFRPVGNGPQVMGVLLERTADGGNWSLTVLSTPTGLTPDVVRLTISAPSGATNLSKTFSTLTRSADGAVFVGSGTTVSVGNRLLVDAVRYPIHYHVQISDPDAVLYGVTLT